MKQILLTSNGWKQTEAAKVLVAIADEEEMHTGLIKQIFEGEGVSNRYVDQMHPTYQDDNKIVFQLGRDQTTATLSVAALSALIATQSPIIIQRILKYFQGGKKVKSKKNWQFIVIAIQAFTLAKCGDENVIKILARLLGCPDVTVEALEYTLRYFCEIPSVIIKYKQLFEGLLKHAQLPIRVLATEAVLAVRGEVNEELMDILVVGVKDADIKARYFAIMVIQEIDRANEKLINGLIAALQTKNFICNSITTFHRLVLETLGRIGRNHYKIIEATLLRFLESTYDEHFYGALQAFKILNYLPDKAVNTIVTWLERDALATNRGDSIENNRLLEVIGDLLRYSESLTVAIEKKLSSFSLHEANMLQWHILLELLSNVGKIPREHLQHIIKYSKQNKDSIFFQKTLERYVAMGSAQQECLFNLLLATPSDAYIFYQAMIYCDMTVYLPVLIKNNLVIDLRTGRNMPVAALLQAYLDEGHTNEAAKACLNIALEKLAFETRGFFIYPDRISWYDTQQHCIELNSGQFDRLVQDITQILPHVLVATANLQLVSSVTPLGASIIPSSSIVAPLQSSASDNRINSPGLVFNQNGIKEFLLAELVVIKDKYGDLLAHQGPRLPLHGEVRATFKKFLAEKLLPFLTDNNFYHEKQPKSIFISYAWAIKNIDTYEQDKLYEGYVEKIAKDLERVGCKVDLDRWFDQPGNVLTDFLERMGKADFFIPIGTCLYLQKYEKRTDLANQKDHVLRTEGQLLNYISAYSSQWQSKIMPILLEGTKEEALPLLLRSQSAISLHTENYFEKFFALVKKIYAIGNRHTAFEKLIKAFNKSIKTLAEQAQATQGDISQAPQKVFIPKEHTVVVASSSTGTTEVVYQSAESTEKLARLSLLAPDSPLNLHARSTNFEVNTTSGMASPGL